MPNDVSDEVYREAQDALKRHARLDTGVCKWCGTADPCTARRAAKLIVDMAEGRK